MIRIDIKPLSVNSAWQGKRYKTAEYKKYEKDVLYLLPKHYVIPDKIELHFVFGFSNSASDLDNPIKLLQDIMQKKYNFNDSHVYRLVVEKQKVQKGKEFFEFAIKEFTI